jgi:hypothetical protein
VDEAADEVHADVEGVEELSIRPFGSSSAAPSSPHRLLGFCVKGNYDGAVPIRISAYGVPAIGYLEAPRRIGLVNEIVRRGRQLADGPYIDASQQRDNRIGLLIGMDYYYEFVGKEVESVGCGLRVVASSLGWLLCGPLKRTSSPFNLAPMMSMLLSSARPFDGVPDESFDLTAFHNVESLGIMDAVGDDKENDQLPGFDERITRLACGRFQVPLTWNGGRTELRSNIGMAKSCLDALMKRLTSKPELLRTYHEIFMQYERDGYISEASDPFDGPRTYLPHHPVLRPDKKTTKVRPVFNGSAQGKSGPSLNNCLFPGPNLNRSCWRFCYVFGATSSFGCWT